MRFSTATLNRAAGARVYGKSLESRARQIRLVLIIIFHVHRYRNLSKIVSMSSDTFYILSFSF